MEENINVGDLVRLLGVPDWLIHDLPEDEKKEIVAHIGKVATITSIDSYGFFWLGFGKTTSNGNVENYSGHSFSVSREYLTRSDTEG